MSQDHAIQPQEVDERVVAHRRLFRSLWREKPESYWLARLMEEIGELAGTLVGDHDDPTDLELTQIAGICINWLEMRLPGPGPTEAIRALLPAPATEGG